MSPPREREIKMAGYNSGFAAVEAAVKRASSKGTGRGPRSNNFTWKEDKEKKILRLLDDEPITIGIHEFTPCKDGKSRDFVCSEQLANPRECWICKNVQKKDFKGNMGPAKPREVGVGYAALREETREGRKFVYTDVLHDVEGVDEAIIDILKSTPGVVVDGTTVKGVPFVGIVKQAVSNFWNQFNAYYARYGTTTDRDYQVTRQGAPRDTKTAYIAIPCDAVDGMVEQEDVDKHYEVAKLLHPTIVEWIERLGSEDYYDYFLISGPKEKTESTEKDSQDSDTEEEKETAHSEAGKDVGGSLRDKLRAYSANK
jgi:hypothetical protein